jgi:hypothetical protein
LLRPMIGQPLARGSIVARVVTPDGAARAARSLYTPRSAGGPLCRYPPRMAVLRSQLVGPSPAPDRRGPARTFAIHTARGLRLRRPACAKAKAPAARAALPPAARRAAPPASRAPPRATVGRAEPPEKLADSVPTPRLYGGHDDRGDHGAKLQGHIDRYPFRTVSVTCLISMSRSANAILAPLRAQKRGEPLPHRRE